MPGMFIPVMLMPRAADGLCRHPAQAWRNQPAGFLGDQLAQGASARAIGDRLGGRPGQGFQQIKRTFDAIGQNRAGAAQGSVPSDRLVGVSRIGDGVQQVVGDLIGLAQGIPEAAPDLRIGARGGGTRHRGRAEQRTGFGVASAPQAMD